MPVLVVPCKILLLLLKVLAIGLLRNRNSTLFPAAQLAWILTLLPGAVGPRQRWRTWELGCNGVFYRSVGPYTDRPEPSSYSRLRLDGTRDGQRGLQGRLCASARALRQQKEGA